MDYTRVVGVVRLRHRRESGKNAVGDECGQRIVGGANHGCTPVVAAAGSDRRSAGYRACLDPRSRFGGTFASISPT